MSSARDVKPKGMPKGGRKGGVTFPRISLEDAVGYAKKLVAKTHTGAQPKDVILAGVMGAKSGRGEIRLSALKQYGLLSGDSKAYTATDLARSINVAPSTELVPLLQKAVLRPAVFKGLFETFHGDTVTRAKLKQRAADLKVHPDELETAVELYVSSMKSAALVTIDGEGIVHLSATATGAEQRTEAEGSGESTDDHGPGNEPPAGPNELKTDQSRGAQVPAEDPPGRLEADRLRTNNSATPRAVFNVNVTLDSSLDTEKLQKQLELLKRFGAI